MLLCRYTTVSIISRDSPRLNSLESAIKYIMVFDRSTKTIPVFNVLGGPVHHCSSTFWFEVREHLLFLGFAACV